MKNGMNLLDTGVPTLDLKPTLRLAMIGGGLDSKIGGTHHLAARLDNRYELVVGAFSSNPEKSKAAAQRFGVPRMYNDWRELFRQEAGISP